MDRGRSHGFVLAPLLTVAALAGHAGAYLLAVPDARARAAALGRTGHGYLTWTPEIVGLAGLLLVVGLALRVLAASRGARSGRIHGAVALVPLGGFLLQETIERLFLGGVSPGLVLERPVAIGIVLQLLLGVVALAVGRLLVRSMERLGHRLGRRRQSRWPSLRAARPTPSHDLVRARPLALRTAGRAPPAPSS